MLTVKQEYGRVNGRLLCTSSKFQINETARKEISNLHSRTCLGLHFWGLVPDTEIAPCRPDDESVDSPTYAGQSGWSLPCPFSNVMWSWSSVQWRRGRENSYWSTKQHDIVNKQLKQVKKLEGGSLQQYRNTYHGFFRSWCLQMTFACQGVHNVAFEDPEARCQAEVSIQGHFVEVSWSHEYMALIAQSTCKAIWMATAVILHSGRSSLLIGTASKPLSCIYLPISSQISSLLCKALKQCLSMQYVCSDKGVAQRLVSCHRAKGYCCLTQVQMTTGIFRCSYTSAAPAASFKQLRVITSWCICQLLPTMLTLSLICRWVGCADILCAWRGQHPGYLLCWHVQNLNIASCCKILKLRSLAAFIWLGLKVE